MLGEVLRQSRRSVSLVKHARFSGCSAPAQADELKAAFAEALPREQDLLKALKKDLHSVNVNTLIGGMRGITALLLRDVPAGRRARDPVPWLSYPRITSAATVCYMTMDYYLATVHTLPRSRLFCPHPKFERGKGHVQKSCRQQRADRNLSQTASYEFY